MQACRNVTNFLLKRGLPTWPRRCSAATAAVRRCGGLGAAGRPAVALRRFGTPSGERIEPCERGSCTRRLVIASRHLPQAGFTPQLVDKAACQRGADRFNSAEDAIGGVYSSR